MLDLDVYVLTTGASPRRHLTATLKALREQLAADASITSRVTVIVNASSGQYAPAAWAIRETLGECRVVLNPTELGIGPAYDAALPNPPEARCVMLLEDDAVLRVPPAVFVRALDAFPAMGAASGQHSPELTQYMTGEFAFEGKRWLHKCHERSTCLVFRADDLQKMRPFPQERLNLDWWLVRDCPQSIRKRGMPVGVLPGGVQHLGGAGVDSTWRSPNQTTPEYDLATLDRLATLDAPRDWNELPGWFDYGEVYDAAVKNARDGDVLVELGCWCGRSLSYLAKAAAASGKKLRVVGVDNSKGSEIDYEIAVLGPTIRANGGKIIDVLRRNLSLAGATAEVIDSDSAEAAKLFADGSCGLVFVDAGHDHAAVQRDLAAWRPKLRPGAIFAGHDYPSRPGVHETVDAYFGTDVHRRPCRAIKCHSSWSVRV